MSTIRIEKIGITRLKVDVIVNAANEGLLEGGGVCGAVFRDAGARKLKEACDKIGHCDTGNAVITPGFELPASYIIHAVGPVWRGGDQKEAELLYSAYREALLRAKEKGCRTIAFPLISAGIFGYPKEKAFQEAVRACRDFIARESDYEIEIIFSVLDDETMNIGLQAIKETE